MIKVKITNEIETCGRVIYDGRIRLPYTIACDYEVYGLICDVKPYDMEKWKNGKIYEFNTLREVNEFIDSCNLEFTEESIESYTCCDWYNIKIYYRIDQYEDNLINLFITYERESND